MTSIVGICNQAIGRTQNSSTIASLTEASVAARQCNANWDQCRDEVLQSFPWACATKRVVLALVDEELVTNWAYCYAYPSDCLKCFGIVVNGVRNPKLSDSVPFEVSTYNGIRVILCDLEDAELIYAWRQEDVATYPPLLVKTLAALMACRIAPALGKGELSQKLESDYLKALHEAAQSEMNESNPGPEPDCDLITVRE